MARWHENLMPVCKELGITYVAFSPLANGALTGAYQSKKDFGSGEQDFRPDMPQYSDEGIKKTNELLEIVLINWFTFAGESIPFAPKIIKPLVIAPQTLPHFIPPPKLHPKWLASSLLIPKSSA